VLDRVFDERFRSAAAGSYAYTPVRIVVGVAIAAIIGFGLGWTVSAFWIALAVTAEVMLILCTRPLAMSAHPTRAENVRCFVAYALAIPAWSLSGLILWSSPNPVCQIAAAGFFAGHLLYIQAHHGHSAAALLPTLSALVSPLVAPLLFPHYSGPDQAVVLLMMGAVSGHSMISLYVSLLKSRDLKAAQLATEAASAAKSEFLARMSHEIRTPLNGVLGMAQALAADGGLKKTQKERLAVIRESGEALTAIINDVLDLSKVEAGRLELEQIEFDLGELVRGARASFETQATSKGLEFSLVFESEAAGRYRGDPTRVRQILYNLLGNALKFTERGEVRLTVARRSERLLISVMDTGIGIEPQHLERLFDRFQQVDSSTTRRFGGTGLGLSICRELAELMGGRIDVASRPGAGSRFTVSLHLERLGDAAEGASAAEVSSVAPLDQLQVLAAEDNPVNQLVLRTLLGQCGVTVEVVPDGEQAVAAWRTGRFDLVLMDVQMPVLDGIGAIRAIRAEEAETGRARTPILALTANAMQHQVREYLQAGADGHVSKPIDAARLFQAMADAVAAAPTGKVRAA
jgi:signal transduction histidine kinase/ActR/RegA family two-component response regulator